MSDKRVGPSTTEIKLRSDVDRLRREVVKLKKALAAAGTPGAPGEAAAAGPAAPVAVPVPPTLAAAPPAAPEVTVAGGGDAKLRELEQTRQRLSKLYFEQRDANQKIAREHQNALRVIGELNADLDLDTLVDRIAATIRESLGFRIALVRLRRPGSDRLEVAATAGLDPALRARLEADELAVGDFESWLKDEFRVGDSYFISHKHPFQRVLPAGIVPDLGPRQDWEWHAEDVLLVPLRDRAGALVGYFSVDDPVDNLVPSRPTVERLEMLGAHAVIAIANARRMRDLEGRAQDLEQTGTRAHEMNSLKAKFVQTISHELRTPLTAIQAYVDTLIATEKEGLGPDRLRSFLGVINDETRRLSRLIESVLDLSRLDAGNLAAVRDSVDLAEILEDSTRLLQPMAETGQLNLKVINGLADTHVDADRDQMRQLVLHLGSNAVKFTPAGGAVTLRMEGDERDVSLVVEDTGIGIPPEALDKVFDRFYQVDSSLVRKNGGTGLGLAICKSIVEWHGGRLFATSTPGQGSCFTAKLPRRGTPRVIVRAAHGPQTATEDLLRLAIEMVAEVMNARVVSLMILQPDGDLTIQAAIGLDARVVRETRVRPGDGVSAWVIEHGRPVCVGQAGATVPAPSNRSRYRTGTFLSVPLQGANGPIGVLNVTEPVGGRTFEPEDSRLLLDLADRVARAWEQGIAVEEGRTGVEDSAEALRVLVRHLKHGRTVAPNRIPLSTAVAQEMRLPDDQVAAIGFAAAVHDVGMSLVGGDLHNRPTELSEEERATMRRHVELGQELLERLEAMTIVREIVLSHHEWWDGSGYPRNLEGDEIPIGARVLAVVDAYESMTCGRAHRAARTRDEALLELERLRGKQFDPEVVAALQRVLPKWDTRPVAASAAEVVPTSPHARR